MKQTISHSQFIQAFSDYGRAGRFSQEALSAIFDYIENYEDETGQETELDVIAICCEWSEDSPENIAENYNIFIPPWQSQEVLAERVMDYLQDNTSAAIGLSNGKIVYIQF